MKIIYILLPVLFLSFWGFSQSCLPDGIDFNTQAQIDNFQLNYPGCTEIEGNVEIQGDGILNLDGLSVLTAIGGYLYITNNDSLKNLSGLATLTSLGGSLLISSNACLTSFTGLENLSFAGEDVFISSNPVLTDISALRNIIAANVTELRISGNLSLTTCDNPFICSYLSSPTGRVNILSNAPGCNNPPEIADKCDITLPCLPYGNYNFFTQHDIDNFQYDYPGCDVLQGVVKISGGDITSLDGLNGLVSINGSLEIHNNPQLASLAGLDSLLAVNGPFTIVGNSLLTDISAISKLDTSVITFLGISTNPLLSECDITSVCTYLSGTYGSSHNNITGNNSGCQNRDEVLQACLVGIQDIPEDYRLFNITPNPSSNRITIETSAPPSKFLLSIFNLNGQEVIHQQIKEPGTVVDISDLPAGLYFVRMTGERTVSVQKFIKID
jgi:hypothetical protein